MTAEEASAIAIQFEESRWRTLDDHTFEARSQSADSPVNFYNEGDDAWDVYIHIPLLKGICKVDYYVIEVNCRTRECTVIRML